MLRMTQVEYKKLSGGFVVPKHRNVETTYNGKHFHSKKEAGYAYYLDGLKAGKIIDKYETQVSYDMIVNKQKICTYVLDFKVYYKDKHIEYIDVKPFDKRTQKYLLTATYILKKKLMKACHNIVIKEA